MTNEIAKQIDAYYRVFEDTPENERIAAVEEILGRLGAAVSAPPQPLEVALRKIADNYGGCRCDHTNADCCEKAGEFCPHCISEIALAQFFAAAPTRRQSYKFTSLMQQQPPAHSPSRWSQRG